MGLKSVSYKNSVRGRVVKTGLGFCSNRLQRCYRDEQPYIRGLWEGEMEMGDASLRKNESEDGELGKGKGTPRDDGIQKCPMWKVFRSSQGNGGPR